MADKVLSKVSDIDFKSMTDPEKIQILIALAIMQDGLIMMLGDIVRAHTDRIAILADCIAVIETGKIIGEEIEQETKIQTGSHGSIA